MMPRIPYFSGIFLSFCSTLGANSRSPSVARNDKWNDVLNSTCSGLYTAIASTIKDNARIPSYSRCVARAISAITAILPARTAAICTPASSTNTSIASKDAKKLTDRGVFLNTLRTPSAISVMLCPDSTMM